MALVATAGRIAGALAAALSLYGLYWVVAIVEAQVYRTSFLLIALVVIFLDRRGARGEKTWQARPSPLAPPPSTGSSPPSRSSPSAGR